MHISAVVRFLPLLVFSAWLANGDQGAAMAQEQGIVVVDESPTAGLLVTQMLDQISGNPDQSARIAIEILESFGSRLVVVGDGDPDHFTTARNRVEQILLDHPGLMARFTELQESNVEGLIESGLLGRAVDVGWLTSNGVHASLVLAQSELEKGYVHAARKRLDRLGSNPLVTPEQEGFRQLMLGAIGALILDQDSIESARTALSHDSSDAFKRSRLNSLVQVLEPLVPDSVDTFESGDVAPLHEEEWHEVWSYPLPRSPMSELLTDSSDSSDVRTRALENLRSNGRAMTTIPLVAGDMIFVNDGGMIQGFDRFGSGVGWTFDLGSNQINIGDTYVDLGEMAYSDNALVAIAGVGQNSGRTTNPEIICLDPRTGELNWTRELNSIQSLNQSGSSRGGFDFSRAFPYGGLLIESGQVIFTVRKVNSRRETVLYLVSLNLEDGHVEWVRFLGSSGGLRTNKGFSRIVSDRGSVLVSSPVGVIARVDALNGDPHWLRRFDVPISRVFVPRAPWQIDQPAILDDRIYALAPNRRQLVQMDWDNGSLEGEWSFGSGSRFGDPEYLVIDGHDPDFPVLYAVGDDIHAMRAVSELPLLWRFSQSAYDEIASRSGGNLANGIRGRVQATSGNLVVPGYGDVFILSSENGRVLDVVESQDASNPLLLNSQLILAGNDSVSSLMQVGQAELMLRQRIQENPEQLSRVLGLMELGIKSGQIGLAFEAARFAVDGLSKADDPEKWVELRGQLISMLLDLSEQVMSVDVDSAEDCLQIANEIAVTDIQRAQVKLALSEMCFRQERDRDGLLLVSEILSDVGLSSVLIPRNGGKVRSSVLARMLIFGDPSAAVLWSEMAEVEFEELTGSDLQQLRVFSRRHSGTSSASQSLIDASGLLANSGEHRLAMECLLESIRVYEPTLELLGEVVARLNALGMREVSSSLVSSCLQRTDFRGLDRTDLLNELEGELSLAEPPMLGPSAGEALLISGSVVPGIGSGGIYVFLQESRLFRLSEPSSQVPDWELPVPGRSIDYVWSGLSHGVLNLVSFEGESFFTTVSITDGQKVGESNPFVELFPAYQPDLDQRRGLIPGGGVYRPESVVIDSINDDSMLVVRRDGDMAMYSIGNTSPSGVPRALWRHENLIRRVYEVFQDERTIVVSGRDRFTDPAGESEDRPRVLLLDSLTGKVVADFSPLSGEDVRWVKITPTGLLLLGTRSGIEARSLSEPSQVNWISNDRLHRGTTRDRVVVFGNHLVVVRSSSTMSAIDLSTGEISPDLFVLPVFEPGDESTTCIKVSSDLDGITVLMDNRVLRWGFDGKLVGIDAISGTPSLIGLFHSRNFDLVLEELARSGRSSARTYWLHRLDPRAGLRITGPQLEIQTENRSTGLVEICPGWILIQNGTEVMSIPMPIVTDRR